LAGEQKRLLSSSPLHFSPPCLLFVSRWASNRSIDVVRQPLGPFLQSLPTHPCSAFYWLVTLFIVSSLFRGFVPLDGGVGPHLALVVVAVAVQEGARFVLWRLHRRILRVLIYISRQEEHAGATLTSADHFALSFTHGLAHATLHSLVFCLVWLPLCLGHGTLYIDTCSSMNYFFVSALSTLGFSAILTGGMVLCFDGLERGDLKRTVAPTAVHFAAALITCLNFVHGGCLISIPLLLVGGAGIATWAGLVWWQTTGNAMLRRPHAPLPEPTAAAAVAATAAAAHQF
jgi:hypothetical protein